VKDCEDNEMGEMRKSTPKIFQSRKTLNHHRVGMQLGERVPLETTKSAPTSLKRKMLGDFWARLLWRPGRFQEGIRKKIGPYLVQDNRYGDRINGESGGRNLRTVRNSRSLKVGDIIEFGVLEN